MLIRPRRPWVLGCTLAIGLGCPAKRPEPEPEIVEAPNADEGCRGDDDCVFRDHCMRSDCDLRSAQPAGRIKCEEGYMGPSKACVCRDAACVVDPPEQPAVAPSPVAMEGPVLIVPNQSIGPISLGMPRERVEAVKLETHPNYSGMTVPITVYFDERDQVSSLEVSLPHAPGDIIVGEATIPKSATADQAAKILGDCGEPQTLIGGSHTACRNGGLALSTGSGDPSELWIRVPAPD